MKKIIKAALFVFGMIAALFLTLSVCTFAGALLTNILPEPFGVIAAMLLLLFIGLELGAICEMYAQEKQERQRRRTVHLILKARKRKAEKPIVYVLQREDWLRLMEAVKEG